MKVLATLLCAFCLLVSAYAKDELLSVKTREGVTNGYYWMPRENASATLLMFSGGDGGIGYRDGVPQSGNFLIRTRDEFAKAGFNLALFGNPSDMRKLGYAERGSAEHVQDIKAVIEDIKKRSDAPVWLVGTSRGTISAAVAAIQLSDVLAGVVLSASYTDPRESSSLPNLALDKIRVPVLMHHHKLDSCRVTQPHFAEKLLNKFVNAPIKKFMLAEGGGNPTGNACEAFHFHGYIGMEAQAAGNMTAWIKKPTP